MSDDCYPHRAYIGLGSNLEQPQRQVQRAIGALRQLPQCRLARLSSLYRSRAIGPGIQPDYINAVASLDTALSALDLLAALQRIERQQGRTRNIRWQPRTLDLDILLYNHERIDSDRLRLPHPEISKRNFVLYPLAEIADDSEMPAGLFPTGRCLTEQLQHCPATDLHKLPAGDVAGPNDSVTAQKEVETQL